MLSFYRSNVFLMCLSVIVILFSSNVYAIFEQEMPQDLIDQYQEQWKPLKVTGDAVSWEVFAKTKEDNFCIEDKEGFEICVTQPEYSDEIMNLDGKKVTLMGFMFPLEQSEKQKRFLIGPYPLSCPFHYHVGPSQVVEVSMPKGIDFSYDPVTVKGTFKPHFNRETGMFYTLENAVEK